MAQYSEGTVMIKDSDRSTVIGFGTAFLSNVLPGQLFTFDKSTIILYTVSSVISDTEIKLSSPYTGTDTDRKVSYSITRDFSGLIGAPIAIHNDKAFSICMTMFLRILDVFMKNNGLKTTNDMACN